MPRLVIRGPQIFEQAFAALRDQLDVPARFPSEVMDEANQAKLADGADSAGDRLDARQLDLVAVDPPGATDLDQAFTATRRDSGYRVQYAIADVGAFVVPGRALDLEARNRGTTLYSPDLRTPLHPPIISEDRSSLLPGVDRPALLWTIDLDAEGNPQSSNLVRAMVRVTEAISYAEAQARIDGQSTNGPDERMSLLAEIGTLRQDREADRGGVSLNLPAQEIVENGDSYHLAFDQQLPVESWNAQISLLTGIVAGSTMLDAGTGILRTLPPVDETDVDRLRRTAKVLGIGWPDGEPYSSFVRRQHPDSPAGNAFLIQAARSFRGAGYVGLDASTSSASSSSGDRPRHVTHGAIASVYAHVTAPLRRLVDRFGNEILLALYADRPPPSWAVEALEELPSLMGRARQRESALERAMLDMAEALILEHSVGQVFDGYVVAVDKRRDRAVVQITDPAIVDTVAADGRSLGEEIGLRLAEVDVANREVRFEVT